MLAQKGKGKKEKGKGNPMLAAHSKYRIYTKFGIANNSTTRSSLLVVS